MDGTQSNRPDNLGDISDSRLIPLEAKLLLAAIRNETVCAHIRDHAGQRPKWLRPPILWQSLVGSNRGRSPGNQAGVAA
jgi:hypothetical protein